MNRVFVVFAALIMLFVFSGCGGSDSDPVAVCKKAMEVSVKLDVDGILDVSCEKMKNDIETSREEIEQMREMMKAMGVDFDTVKFDLSGLNYELIEETESTAKVHISGAMKVEVAGMDTEEQEMDQDAELVKENGQWKICSEIE